MIQMPKFHEFVSDGSTKVHVSRGCSLHFACKHEPKKIRAFSPPQEATAIGFLFSSCYSLWAG